MNELLDTRNRSKINEKAEGLSANRPYLLPQDQTAGAQEGGGGGPGGWWRRCSGRREARPRHKTDRVDQGELDDGAHRRGGRRNRPVFEVNAGGIFSSLRFGLGCCRAAAALCSGRRRRAEPQQGLAGGGGSA
jgi:hypothetical protein